VSNRKIAEVLAEIASLLEIKGENVFKVRAYEKAADTLEGLTEEVSALRARGELRALPGVGAGIAEKMEELLDTGKCAYHQELLAEFPPGLLEMLHISEVGPKTVKLLYETLGIASVADLEAAARQGRLRGIKHLGEKTEANILKGIERMRRFAERFALALAYPTALEIAAALRKSAPVDKIEPAGSLRRMKDTIGDLDILVTSKKPEEVMEAFASLPMVREVTARGPTKTSLITEAGLQADLRVVAPEEFGAALMYFTGSKDHNIKLRELAVKRKLRINEYGVFNVKTEKRLGGKTEEEMYGALKLPWIPPEIREDQGEIEAALENALPLLVEEKDIRGDLHVHSDWSDGKASMEEMVKAAQQRDYEYIAFCDHSPAQPIANGLSIERLRERRKEILHLRKKFPNFAILAGTEVDIRGDGSLDYPDEVLAELDFVVASIHTGWKATAEANTRRTLKAISNPWVDVIGHPTGRLIGQRDPLELDLEEILKAAAKAGVAMEIDSHPDRLDLKDVHARRAKELGVKLVIDTDAHHLDGFDLMRFGVATARRGWIGPADVLNTLPRKDFLSNLRPRPGRKKQPA
jgi:DNA polymerase (family 10)